MRNILKEIIPKLFFLSLFILFLFPINDTDIFWHLRCGEIMTHLRRLCTPDTFSYTMSGFSWLYHGWTYEIFIYNLHKLFGWWGLSIFGSTILLLSFYIIYKTIGKTLREIIIFLPLIIIGLWPRIMVGIRAQYLALLLFCTLMYLLAKKRQGKIFPFILIPFLFLIWANVHGTFVIGLSLLFIDILVSLSKADYRRISSVLLLAIVAFSSIALTLINPFGIRIYGEILNEAQVSTWYLEEYRSPSGIQIIYMSILALGVFYRTMNERRERILKTVTISIFYLLSLKAQRILLFYYPLSIYFLAESVDTNSGPKYIRKLLSKNFVIYSMIAITFGVGLVKLPTVIDLNSNQESFCGFYYPCGATNFLKKQNAQSNIFSDFGWGGFVGWKLPASKVFIDSRMYRWPRANKETMFYYYQRVILGSPNALKILEESKTQSIIIPNGVQLDNFLKRFPSDWKENYRDKMAVIYTKLL